MEFAGNSALCGGDVNVKQGDFTLMAQKYIHRTGYAPEAVRMLGLYTGVLDNPNQMVVDVGAGTGKFTLNLAQVGLNNITAIEPNDAMRAEGISYTNETSINWHKGSAESIPMADNVAQWITMASSFHWTDAPKALAEFHRVLKPGGHFTALWNPRDLENNALHSTIENRIYSIAPQIKRVSSGSSKYTEGIADILMESGYFSQVIFTEGYHVVEMTPETLYGGLGKRQ